MDLSWQNRWNHKASEGKPVDLGDYSKSWRPCGALLHSCGSQPALRWRQGHPGVEDEAAAGWRAQVNHIQNIYVSNVSRDKGLIFAHHEDGMMKPRHSQNLKLLVASLFAMVSTSIFSNYLKHTSTPKNQDYSWITLSFHLYQKKGSMVKDLSSTKALLALSSTAGAVSACLSKLWGSWTAGSLDWK